MWQLPRPVVALFIMLEMCWLLDEEDGEEDGDVEEDEDQEVMTVVYFWQGRHANNMGWLHFTHR